MKVVRKALKPFLLVIVLLVLLFFTNASVNRHQHFWRGMVIEHAHPFNNPFEGHQHQHSGTEILILNFLSASNVDNNAIYQSGVLFFAIEEEIVTLGNSKKALAISFIRKKLRAPPVLSNNRI